MNYFKKRWNDSLTFRFAAFTGILAIMGFITSLLGWLSDDAWASLLTFCGGIILGFFAKETVNQSVTNGNGKQPVKATKESEKGG